MKISRKNNIYPFTVFIVVIALLAYYFVYVKNAGALFDRSVEDGIESWNGYHLTEKTLGSGICDNKQFETIIERLNTQTRSVLYLHSGLQMMITENPLNWSNAQFRDHAQSKCTTTKGFVPVRVYRDKLLWKNQCSGFHESSFISPCNDIQNSIIEWEENHATSSKQNFNEAGIRFETLLGYHLGLSGWSNRGYHYFSFYPDGTLGGYSGIQLFIPLKEELDANFIGEELGFSVSMPDLSEGKQIVLDGEPGRRVTERHTFPESPPYPWDGEYVYEYYPVQFRYSNLPVILVYHHAYADDVMQPFWEKMHDTWQFKTDNL
ncbi:MAG: hypothetical protein Q8Q20_01970 [bacterium]|nr:hypothetical protein [bacterium]